MPAPSPSPRSPDSASAHRPRRLGSRPTRRAVVAALVAGGAVAALGGLTLMDTARAAKDEIYTGLLSGTALGGYDAVAYHTDGKAVPGSSAHTLDWKGAAWRFSSAENLAAFRARPEKYAPRYGGHCAWAVSQGYTAKGDPEIWKIVDGRLYLNYNADVQTKWEQDIPGNITSADANWPRVLE